MKLLKDLCLDFLAVNLNGIISRVNWGVATTHKEDLIERLVNHDKLTANYLPHITYNLFAPTLKRLVLYRSSQLTDEFLNILGSSQCQLTELVIVKCNAITDAGIISVTKNQTSLQRCVFKHLHKLTSKALSALRSPALDSLDLSGSSFDATAVKMVLKNNSDIHHLVLTRCKYLDNSVLTFVAQRLGHKLETLELVDNHYVTDVVLLHVADHCPNLTKLNLYGCNKITNEGLNMINSKCSRLKHVDLSYCTGLDETSTAFSLLTLPSSLCELSLCGVMFKNAELLVQAIVRLTLLRRVNFCGVVALTDEAIEQILCAIGEKLEVLDLNGGLMSPLSDSAVASIVRHCPRLTNISLSLNQGMTGTPLIPLLEDVSRAKRLTCLNLSLKKLDANVLYHVSRNCCNLEELHLSGVPEVTDDFLVSIAQLCPNLQYIGLKGCRQVTDVGICELAKCSSLTCAVLSGIHRLTDRSVLTLANGCPHLEEIYLSGCSLVTRAAIRYLVNTCIPRVYWEHRIPNMDPEMMLVHSLDDGEYFRVHSSDD